MLEKLKSILADDALYFSALIILVGIVSFGLGRQSIIFQNNVENQAQKAGVVFTKTPVQEKAINEESLIEVVASRSGSKYHLLSCPGAKQIKEENKIYFDSAEQAKAAGFQPAANCPELK